VGIGELLAGELAGLHQQIDDVLGVGGLVCGRRLAAGVGGGGDLRLRIHRNFFL
jgi:hypothetical protein